MNQNADTNDFPKPTSLKWVASLTSTAIYAAEAVSRGLPLLPSQLDHRFLDAARDLRQWIVSTGRPPASIWNQLGGLSADIEDPHELASGAISKSAMASDRAAVTALGEFLHRLKDTIRMAFPDLVEELIVRAKPIREQWESRGPGLLEELNLQTGLTIAPQSAEVLLVAPILGGGGHTLFKYDRVFLEAVSDHVNPDIPETVRLAWLIAQLGAIHAELGDSIPEGRFPLVIQLALLPPVLIAAESVGWMTFSPQQIRDVLATWHIPTLPDRPIHEWLVHWWENHRQASQDWNTSLRSLDQWLG